MTEETSAIALGPAGPVGPRRAPVDAGAAGMGRRTKEISHEGYQELVGQAGPGRAGRRGAGVRTDRRPDRGCRHRGDQRCRKQGPGPLDVAPELRLRRIRRRPIRQPAETAQQAWTWRGAGPGRFRLSKAWTVLYEPCSDAWRAAAVRAADLR